MFDGTVGLDIQIPIRKRDIKNFDLRTVNLTIASILSHIHSEIHCEYCEKTMSQNNLVFL